MIQLKLSRGNGHFGSSGLESLLKMGPKPLVSFVSFVSFVSLFRVTDLSTGWVEVSNI
jgi:hypothetical protein